MKKPHPSKSPQLPPSPERKTPHSAMKPPVHIPIKGKGAIIIHSPKIIQNGITRPRAVYLGDGRAKPTFRVWEIADQLAASFRRPPTRQEMMVACAAEGNKEDGTPRITFNLFNNNFYAWRKFNGLNGRIKKDGTIMQATGGSSHARELLNAPPAEPKPKRVFKKRTLPTVAPATHDNIGARTAVRENKAKKPATKPPFPVAKSKLPFPIPAVK